MIDRAYPMQFRLNTNKSLRQKILTIFNAGLLFFTVILIFLIDHNIKNTAISKAVETQGKQASFFATLIDKDVAEALSAISSRAANMHSLHLSDQAVELSLNSLQRSMTKYSWIGYTDTNGIVKAATQGMLVGKDVSKRPWFIEGQIKNTTIDVHDAVLLAKMLKEDDPHSPMRFIDVASPVLDAKGTPMGVLGGHLSISWLNNQLHFYTRANENAKNSMPFVIGHDGQFRFGNQDAYEGLIDLANFWQQKQNSGFVLLEHKKHGEMLVSFTKHSSGILPNEMGWVTVISTPVETIISGATQTRLIAASGVIGLAFLAWLMMFKLTQLTHQPIEKLLQAIENIDESHTQVEELEGLPEEFDAIRQALNKLLRSLKDREKNLNDLVTQVNTSFKGVTDNFPGVLFSLEDCRGHCFDFTYLSNSVKEYFHITGPTPRMAKEFFEKVLVDNSQENVEFIRQQLIQDHPIDFVVQTKGKQSDVRHMRFKGHPRTLANGMLAWDGIAIDVTDLVTAQQSATAAHEAKSKFLATMSHEIRTPLNGILGFAQILKDELTSSQAQKDVQKIIDTADTLTRILNDILDFSKIEAGKIDIESKPFTFVELTTAVGDIFTAEAKQRGLNFALNLSGQANTMLLGDPTRLRQVITNLVSNATKFTSHGQVSLNVDVNSTELQQAKVRITVKDTGIGITKEHMHRLFQRFEQSDSTTFRKYGGSGLGLAIVKGLIDAMHGTIKVDSRVGNGTTFTIDIQLPLIQAPNATLHSETPQKPVALKILVVDDVDTNREIICRGLKKDGHEFTQAANGQQALELAQAQVFDLILMDLDMPILDGFESAQKIREDSKNKETFIVALSGFAYENDIKKIHQVGMNLHIAKPLNLNHLKKIIAEHFGTA
jgi:signal transduction histidine kinase/CheY-like chemotaxis protein